MDVNEYLHDPRSRRTFLRGAGVTFVGGSAMFIAACGDDKDDSGSDTSTSADTGKGDVAILNSALDLEHTAVAAYTAGAALLTGAVLEVGKQFLAQEKEHVLGLEEAIKQMGGKPNGPKSSYDFPTLSNQMDVLKFANDLEHTAVAAYVGAIPKLTDPKLRGTAAAIVTNEAEHISVLLGALGADPFGQAPDAFVTGTKS